MPAVKTHPEFDVSVNMCVLLDGRCISDAFVAHGRFLATHDREKGDTRAIGRRIVRHLD